MIFYFITLFPCGGRTDGAHVLGHALIPSVQPPHEKRVCVCSNCSIRMH